MKKTLVAGVVGLMSGLGLVVPHFANAAAPAVPYNGECPTSPVGVIQGPGNQLWVCADADAGLPVDGGGVGVGVTTDNGPTRVCVGGTYVDTSANKVGAYVVVDGDNENIDPLDGYAGISNYESGDHNEDCNQSNDGNGSNSGGSFGLDAVKGTELPLPFVCGNSSGNNFGSTGRDGCYNP